MFNPQVWKPWLIANNNLRLACLRTLFIFCLFVLLSVCLFVVQQRTSKLRVPSRVDNKTPAQQQPFYII